MTTKARPSSEGNTSNVNTNTNNINIHIEPPLKKTRRSPSLKSKKSKPNNWLLKTIIGAIITLVGSLCLYYLQQGMGENTKNPENLPRVNQIEGVKQN